MLRNSFLLLDGIGKTTEQRIWQQGITTWNDFCEADSIKRIGDSKKSAYSKELKKADKNLEKRNEAFFNFQLPDSHHWRLYDEFSQEAAYIDIETTGLDKERNKVTTVSVYDTDGARTLVRGQDLTAERLQEELRKHSLLVTFNGKRFDMPFLKHNFDIRFEQPHVDLMYACKRIGLTGGLKSIEKQLQIDRGDLDDVDGKEAIRLWKRYQRGDENALETLIDYNQQDVINLEPVMDEVYQRLTKQKFEPHIS